MLPRGKLVSAKVEMAFTFSSPSAHAMDSIAALVACIITLVLLVYEASGTVLFWRQATGLDGWMV